jgi:hypothetical protein
MTLAEKVGLFFQTMIAMGPDGASSEADLTFDCRRPTSTSTRAT